MSVLTALSLAGVQAHQPVGAATVVVSTLYALVLLLAAWWAGWQVARSPFVWEKTPHGLSRSRAHDDGG